MKYNQILILFLLQFFLLSGFWAIDIGVSGMMMDQEYGSISVQGLGFIRNANTQYHIGLIIVYVVFFIQLAWLLYIILSKVTTNK